LAREIARANSYGAPLDMLIWRIRTLNENISLSTLDIITQPAPTDKCWVTVQNLVKLKTTHKP